MSELHELTALELGARLRAREVGVREAVDHFLDRIDRLDHRVGAFVTVTADAARAQAAAAQRVLDAGADVGPMFGVPTAIKDLQATAGVPTRLGSAVFADWVPDYDDHVVTLLRGAGTISLGKTATPELGLPCYTETATGPPARTPWDLDRLAGGSSGGAGAAVAAGLVPVAQGSDGGGSVRIPASVCGLVGLKTSRGRVSRGPVDTDSTGLSVIGPLALTVRDAAAFLDAVAVPQPGDPEVLPLPPGGFLAACEHRPGPLRIGALLESPMAVELDPAVGAVFGHTRELLAALGHEVVDIGAPLPPAAVPAFETVWAVSAAAAPVDPAREAELTPLTRHLRERGRAVSGAQYAQALGTLRLLARRAVAATAGLDAVLVPTLAQTPRPVGWFTAGGDPAADFERQKRFTPWTALFNTTGQPAVSLPLGWTDQPWAAAAGRTGARDGAAGGADGPPAPALPIGMALVGAPRGEAALLALAAQVEAAAAGPGPVAPRRSPLVGGGSLR